MLSAGIRLGPYEILAPLGAGGMGEVYRATDTRLDRSVAVKVLSERLTISAEVRKRFDREARAISSLQHPHICTLYDVGREGETDYLVMELLEGQSLAQALSRGPLPISRVLELGSQIASALEKAHGAGIVHRDLKPGNVFLTPHGAKLLDFGLARLHAAEPAVSVSGHTDVETEDYSEGLTGAGVIAGTLQYMAPEQLEGKPADARSDLFAFGAMLFEMATGTVAFSGENRAALVRSIAHDTPPPVSSLVPTAPRALDRLVATCLAKAPADRWHDVHDLRLQLEAIAYDVSSPDHRQQAGIPEAPRRRRPREWLGWAFAAASLAAAVAAYYLPRASGAADTLRLQVIYPSHLRSISAPRLSPNGRYLAFAATDADGMRRVWLRPFDAVASRPIAGTEGATIPFWSPDSRFIGFVAGGRLKKIAIGGGPAEIICDADPYAGDGSWAEDGTILFGNTGGEVRRVSSRGGPSSPVAGSIGWLRFLPGGKKILYGVPRNGRWEVNIANADGSGGRVVMSSASQAEYVLPGYLLFARDTTLLAQRFDASAGTLGGDPVPVAEGLVITAWGYADFSASRNGVLAYRTGEAESLEYVWLDHAGRASPAVAVAEADSANNFDVSPDGRWLAYESRGLASSEPGSEGFRIWLRDLTRGASTQIAFDSGDHMCPLFTPDGRELLFVRWPPDEPSQIVARSLDGSGTERVIYEDPQRWPCPETFAPGSTRVLFDRQKDRDSYDLWHVDIRRPGSAAPLVVTQFSSSRPSVSPDGRWLAFQANDSGRDEIYVTAMTGKSARWQISTSGGREPQWGPDGTELFFVSAQNQLMRAEVTTGAAFDVGESRPLFPLKLRPELGRNRYVLSADGKRFLVQSSRLSGAPLTVVLNWSVTRGREDAASPR